jgi:hypothetical protein
MRARRCQLPQDLSGDQFGLLLVVIHNVNDLK